MIHDEAEPQQCSFTWWRVGDKRWNCTKAVGHPGRHRLEKTPIEQGLGQAPPLPGAGDRNAGQGVLVSA